MDPLRVRTHLVGVPLLLFAPQMPPPPLQLKEFSDTNLTLCQHPGITNMSQGAFVATDSDARHEELLRQQPEFPSRKYCRRDHLSIFVDLSQPLGGQEGFENDPEPHGFVLS